MTSRNLAIVVVGVAIVAMMLLPTMASATPTNENILSQDYYKSSSGGASSDGTVLTVPTIPDGVVPEYRADVTPFNGQELHLLFDVQFDYQDGTALNNVNTDRSEYYLAINYQHRNSDWCSVRYYYENTQPYGLHVITGDAVEGTGDIIISKYQHYRFTELVERLCFSFHVYESGGYWYGDTRMWNPDSNTSSYNNPLAQTLVKRTSSSYNSYPPYEFLVTGGSSVKTKMSYNQYVTQFYSTDGPPTWAEYQRVTTEVETYDPWRIIQTTTTEFTQIVPQWRTIQTVTNDIVSHMVKWNPLQTVHTSYKVQFPVWTMIQKVGQHLNVTSLISQGVNLFILLSVILLPSLIAYAIVGRSGLIIGLMATTILWTINEPSFITSGFVIWTTCGVVLWRSIR